MNEGASWRSLPVTDMYRMSTFTYGTKYFYVAFDYGHHVKKFNSIDPIVKFI